MKIRSGASVVVVAASLLLGGTVALAPGASAVGRSACRYDSPDVNFKVDSTGARLRTGPAKRYHSKGVLHRGDVFRYYCRTNPGPGRENYERSWSYGKIVKRTATGIPAGTRGWVYSKYLD